MSKRISARCSPGACCTRTLLAVGPALLAISVPAWSQDRANDTRAGRGLVLEEILVTARRREESLQDVPLSVSALDARRLSELQADDLTEMQFAVPNLYFDRGDGANAVVYLRGIGQNDSLAFADPGVGVYVDDVFIARSQTALLELFDVERVEVLRGPQGTLYGRNTIGGAIKFVSTRPPDEFDMYAEAGAGNYDALTFNGRIGGPLVDDKLNGKIAVHHAQREGYARNQFTGEDDGDTDTLAWRAALAWTPTDRLDVLFSIDGKRDRPDASRSPLRETTVTGFADPVGDPLTPTVFAPGTDPYVVDVNANGWSDLESNGVSLKARWTLSDAWSLESISAWREMDFDLILDTDGSPLPILDILVLEEQRQFSQELRASYVAESFDLTGGLYYFNDDDSTFSGFDDGSAALLGFPVTAFGFPTSALAQTDQKTESIAVFVDLSYELSDKLDLGLGVRYTYEEKESRRIFENFFDIGVSVIEDTPPFMAGAGVPGIPIAGEADFDDVTPKLSLAYHVGDETMLYASVARGFKSGGFDGRAVTDFQFQAFQPETVWGYEAGFKSTLADGKVMANGAAFYNDYTDLQVTSFGADPDTGVFQSLFTNAAKARIQGLEFEMAARPREGFDLNATVAWLDAEYDEFNILVGGTVTDVSGRPMVNSPEWSASLGATYGFALGANLRASLHADAAYRDKTYTEITASEVLAADAYVLVNAFAALRSDDDHWELRAGVRNLTDREVRVQGFNLSEFPGYQLSFYRAPRTYDLRVFYRY